MFEKPASEKRSKLWAYLPIAGVIFAAVVAVIVLTSKPDPQTLEPLTDVLHAGDPDYEWYSQYVSLENSSIKMAGSFSGKRMVIFTGVINNQGEKTLDAVEVNLILINRDQPIHEVVKAPIRPGPYTPPIQPLESRAFTVYLEDFPDNWMTSRAEMQLHGFRFLEETRSPSE